MFTIKSHETNEVIGSTDKLEEARSMIAGTANYIHFDTKATTKMNGAVEIPMRGTADRVNSLTTDHQLLLTTANIPKAFGVGCIPKGRSARKVDHGPKVPGPWAYAYPHCTVIAKDPSAGTKAELERLKKEGKLHPIKNGDVLKIDVAWYEVKVKGREHIDLVRCF